jgi:hypothetical protein
MFHHFHPPHFPTEKEFQAWLTAMRIWWAFRAFREAGQND